MADSNIKASVYARKSTDQTGIAEDQKSVTRQIERARQYCAKQGWSLSDDHIYTDDGVSGAEFARRPGFVRLMASLDPKPPFQRLVMMESSRLGREQVETSFALKQLVTSGVRVFTYLDDHEMTLNSPLDKMMNSLSAFADELEREKARARVYDALRKRAEEGKVTAGACFGYTNNVIELPMGADGSMHRSHVERVVNPDQAKVVVRIFELYAEGYGCTRIAKRLNAEKALCPKPQQGRKPAWAQATVRSVLNRSLYKGVVTWNQTRKCDKWGQVKPTKRPENEWVITPMEELRIVPAELVAKVEAQQKAFRSRQLRLGNGTLLGRPPAEGTKHLLTGLVRCACGSTIESRRQTLAGKKREFVYCCRNNARKGKSVCSNNMRIQAPVLENAILRQIEDVMLDSDLIREALDQVVARIEGDGGKARELELQSEIKRLKMEISRFIEAIAQGTDSKSLSTELKNREARLEEAELELEALHVDQSTAWRKDPKVRQALESRIKDWKSLLRRHTPQASQILKKLIDGTITLTPNTVNNVRFYSFEGVGTVNGLLAGVVPQKLPSPQRL